LQTKKKGTKAKSITTKEFEDVMRHFAEKAENVQDAFSSYFDGQGPFFAFDHATWHTAADLTPIGILEQHLHPVPVGSPDFQKPIEHCFGWLAKKFQDKLYTTSVAELSTPAQYRQCVYSLFHSIPTMYIKKDIRSLKSLYNVVMTSRAHGGVDGDWPPKQYT
jgi:hypothetical protein